MPLSCDSPPTSCPVARVGTKAPSATAALRVVRELLVVVGGKLATFGSLFISGVIVARVTDPSEYGVYCAALSLVLLIDAVLGSPCDLATIRFASLHADQPERLDRLHAASFRIKIILGLCSLLLAALLGDRISRFFFGDGGRGGLLQTVLLASIVLLLMRGSLAFLQVKLRFAEYAWLDALLGIARLAVVIFALCLGLRTAGPYVGAYGIGTLAVFLLALWRVPQAYLRAPCPEPRELRAVTRYLGTTILTVGIGTLSARADVLIVSALHSTLESGYYGAAFQVSMAATMVATYTGVIVQPRLIPLVRSGRLSLVLWWNFGVGILAGGAATLIAVYFAPDIVRVLFGPTYADSTPVLRILLVATCLDLLGAPVLLPFAVQLFPRTTLAAEAATTACFLACSALIVPAAGAMGMAGIALAVRLVKLFFYLAIALKNHHYLREHPDALDPA